MGLLAKPPTPLVFHVPHFLLFVPRCSSGLCDASAGQPEGGGGHEPGGSLGRSEASAARGPGDRKPRRTHSWAPRPKRSQAQKNGCIRKQAGRRALVLPGHRAFSAARVELEEHRVIFSGHQRTHNQGFQRNSIIPLNRRGVLLGNLPSAQAGPVHQVTIDGIVYVVDSCLVKCLDERTTRARFRSLRPGRT